MREVAAAAGVSLKTVSRVYNGDPHVRPETRARVQQALGRLNYTPNTLATTFRSGRADVIGLAVPDITDPFFAAIVEAADREASARGVSMLVSNLGDDPAREPDMLQALLARQVQGLIVAPISADQSYLRQHADRAPIVFVDRTPASIHVDSFSDDDHGGTIMAVEHLVSHGSRRIGFVGETPQLSTSRARLEAYRTALEEAGLEVDDRLVALDVGTRESADAALEAFARAGVDGIFSCSPRCSMALVPALRGRRIRWVGFGDFPMADMLQPAVTVIDQDPQQIGRRAVQRLFDRLDAPTRRYRRRTILPVHLIERESCLL